MGNDSAVASTLGEAQEEGKEEKLSLAANYNQILGLSCK